MPQNSRLRESGSALVYVFIGILLFAALVYTFSKSSNNTDTSTSSATDSVIASEILSYGKTMAKGVETLQVKGCSDNQISFENPAVTGYINPNAPSSDKRCNLFDQAGGYQNWLKPPQNSNDGSDWVFTDNRIGTLDETTADMGTIKSELVIILPNVKTNICDAINTKLGNPSVWESSGSHMMTKFTGTYNFDNGGGTRISRGNLQPLLSAACFCDAAGACTATDPRYFYQVLLIR